MNLFEHTSKEPGMWRGWLSNGQSVELSLGKRGWEFGAGVHIHSNDSDLGDRILFLKFWRGTAVIPLGIIEHPWPPMDGPQWSIYASREFGLTLHWGLRRWSADWPWDRHVLAYEEQMPDGSWRNITYGEDNPPYRERHPYTYVLRSGVVQNRIQFPDNKLSSGVLRVPQSLDELRARHGAAAGAIDKDQLARNAIGLKRGDLHVGVLISSRDAGVSDPPNGRVLGLDRFFLTAFRHRRRRSGLRFQTGFPGDQARRPPPRE